MKRLLGISLTILGLIPSLLYANTQSLAPNPEDINLNLRKSVVNILCRSNSSFVNGTVGTGVLISKDGVILTNAHLGQYFLLERMGLVSCFIRNGSPAKGYLRALPLYISEKWLQNHPATFLQESPTGTGENDFALLSIATTSLAGNNFVPAPLTIDRTLQPRKQLLAIAYPVGELGSFFIEHGLYASSAIPEITDILTFGTSTVDLLVLSGTVLAQRGSSGGLIANLNGNMAALITTISEEGNTNERTVGAITLSHIASSFASETNLSLGDFIVGNIPRKTQAYLSGLGKKQAERIIETLSRSFSLSR